MLLTSLCAATVTLNSVACLSDVDNSTADLPSVSAQTMGIDSPSIAKPTASEYLVGAGKADITGPAAETGMFGYAAKQVVTGINDRLYSRAFIIAEADAETNRIVYVSADLGAMFTAVKVEVIKRLQVEFGTLYTDENVMLTAIHTHVGNGGYSHQKLYQLASQDDTQAGYSQQTFEAIVDGIVRSIKRAHNSLVPGKLSLAQGKLAEATRNRSLVAYHANPEAKDFDSSVNEVMTQLRLDAADDTPLGLINWFAIHPTSFSNQFSHLSADNKGYAQLGMEAKLRQQHNPNFVAAFANADEGDVVASGGNAYSAPGYEGSENEWENVIRDGSLQLKKATELWNQGHPVSGPIDTRSRWINLAGYEVSENFTQGDGPQKLCVPARGYSFASGAENGPSDIPGIYEGMTKDTLSISDKVNKTDRSVLGSATRAAFGVVGSVSQDACQLEKPVLLPTGKWGWVNSQQPVQLMRIGNLGLIAIPGEPTTMVGRHLRQAVAKELAPIGVDTLVVAGLANNYSGYVTTRAEYAQQHYEGASTEFGPYQASAYQQEYVQLAQALREGSKVTSEIKPPDRSNKRFAERPGVTFDDKPVNQAWGQVLIQPKDSYHHNELVSVTFRGAHPKNNLRTEDTFLKVQRLHQGKWRDYLTDTDFETRYTWEREGIAYSKVTIDWHINSDTPPGTYRIMHLGDWKNGWDGTITPYAGVSHSFKVE
ncbi:neutral/alkaline non-lysosomal ceramidase N-terminal domain-containing protein [Psychrobacter sp. UBA3962]|uniref:neutral/alkaline non-lysosomal ceramidase N-terminal domain-containing protein n=1 Tax=Psychrobacter sp. UBA3962 TaxID=1947352 RepID=UPI0025D0EC22|nr:neutral/alkaline non-lysosomal ceramidase N-terminal domain-containing protein [Psychrobacter sp. UBA3962]